MKIDDLTMKIDDFTMKIDDLTMKRESKLPSPSYVSHTWMGLFCGLMKDCARRCTFRGHQGRSRQKRRYPHGNAVCGTWAHIRP